MIDDYEKEEIPVIGIKPRFILRRTTNNLLIPITKEMFETLSVSLGVKE